MSGPTNADIAAAEAAYREYQEGRREPGQMALVLWRGSTAFVLASSGSVFSTYLDLLDDPPDSQEPAPDGRDGLWLWHGWAYLTDGSTEYPNERDLQLGGEYRRLTDAEAIAFARDGDLRSFTTEAR